MAARAETRWRMQCMAFGCVARACAIGPNAGASMTTNSDLAIHRDPHILESIAVGRSLGLALAPRP